MNSKNISMCLKRQLLFLCLFAVCCLATATTEKSVVWDFSVWSAESADLQVSANQIEDSYTPGKYLIYHRQDGDGFAASYLNVGSGTIFNGASSTRYVCIRSHSTDARLSVTFADREGLNSSTDYIKLVSTLSDKASALATIKPTGENVTTSDIANLTAGQDYYLVFSKAMHIRSITWTDCHMSSLSSNTPETVVIAPGSATQLSVSANETGITYTYQWYKNTQKSIVGATPLDGQTASACSAYSESDGSTSYYFCKVTSKETIGKGAHATDHYAILYSNITIMNPENSEQAQEPIAFYEFTLDGTKTSVYNNGNGAPIGLTMDGSDPTVSPTAITVLPTDGVESYGYSYVTSPLTLKLYCKAAGRFTNSSPVVTRQIPVVGAGEVFVTWPYHDSQADPTINTNPDAMIATGWEGATFGPNQTVRHQTMSQIVGGTATSYTGDIDKAAGVNKVSFEVRFNSDITNLAMEPNLMFFRANRSKGSQGKALCRMQLFDSKGAKQREVDVLLNLVDSDLGWVETMRTEGELSELLSLLSRKVDGKRLVFTVYSWNFRDGEYLGLSNVTMRMHYDTSNGKVIKPLSVGSSYVVLEQGNSVNIPYTANATVTAESSNTGVVEVASVSASQITLRGVGNGTATVTVTQPQHANYPQQQTAITVKVSSTGRYHTIGAADEVFADFYSSAVADAGWIEYTGTSTGYFSSVASNCINPLTEAKTFDDQQFYLARMVSDANSMNLYVNGARSVSVYARSHESGSSSTIYLSVDGGASQSFEVENGTSSMSFVNLPDAGNHRVTITGNVYVYAVRVSPKLTSDFSLTNNNVALVRLTSGDHAPIASLYTHTTGGDQVSGSLYNNGCARVDADGFVWGVSTGTTYLTFTQAATSEYRQLSRSATLNVSVDSRAEEVVTEATVWDLMGNYEANVKSNLGLWSKLYWNTSAGVADDTKESSSYTAHLKGLKCNNSAQIYFNLPDGNMGGLLKITFGARKDGSEASITVNGKEDFTSSTHTSHTWMIEPNTLQVLIQKGASGESVITKIEWTPTASKYLPGVLEGEYTIISEATSRTPDFGVSLDGNATYLLPVGTYVLSVSPSAYHKSIIISGSSTNSNAYVSISDCTSDAVNCHLTAVGNTYSFKPTVQNDSYILTVAGASANVYVRVETANYCRSSLSSGKVGTLCVPYNVNEGDFGGARFFELHSKTTSNGQPTGEPTELYFKEVFALEAGRPYLFVSHDKKIGLDYVGGERPEVVWRGFHGTYNTLMFSTVSSDYDTEAAKAGGGYYMVNDLGIFKKATKTSGLYGNRAYIKMSEVPLASQVYSAPARRLVLGARGFDFEDDEAETSIEEVQNGIPSDVGVFDLMGRPVSERFLRGLLIMNGKKVIIR